MYLNSYYNKIIDSNMFKIFKEKHFNYVDNNDDEKINSIKELYKKLDKRVLLPIYKIQNKKDYYNLNINSKNTETKINIIKTWIENINNEYHYNIIISFKYLNYKKYVSNIIFDNIPYELSSKINSYLYPAYIDVTFKITIDCYTYPFTFHKWKFLNTKIFSSESNLTINEINTFYKNICIEHQNDYFENWTPAISLEHDILDLITKMNFELFI